MAAKNSASQEAAASAVTPSDKVASTESPAPTAAPSHEDLVRMSIEFLESNGYAVRMRTASQRVTAVKAEPDAVKAYFDSTGLTRKQIADAVGVTVSVIATVQNPNGDRWSLVRFEAAKILIDAYKTALAALTAPKAEAVVEAVETDPLAAAAASLEATDPAAAEAIKADA